MSEILEGDCRELMLELDAESIDAIVTSPPYADLRPDGISPDDFHEWIRPVLEQAARVLVPLGGMMLNLGPIHRGGFEHPYIDRTIAVARELGFGVLDTILWIKSNAAPPSTPRQLHRRHEFVHWLGLDPGAYRGFDAETRPAHAAQTLDRYTRPLTKRRRAERAQRGDRSRADYGNLHPDGARPPNIVTSPVGRYRDLGHSSPMALEVATYLVALACPEGGLVLDPFAGAGTTGVACGLLGRRFVGIEVDERHAEISRRRLAQPSLLSPA